MTYMDAVMAQLSDTVSDERGTFHALVMARGRNDGSWEGWLEFVPKDKDSGRYTTPIETRQHDRVTMERWASGLTVVYADGALARARPPHTATAESDQLLALQELIEALDRRVPHVERAGETKIADDGRRLRAAASERIALLKKTATILLTDEHPESERRNKQDRRSSS
jgi:hypothetical protein